MLHIHFQINVLLMIYRCINATAESLMHTMNIMEHSRISPGVIARGTRRIVFSFTGQIFTEHFVLLFTRHSARLCEGSVYQQRKIKTTWPSEFAYGDSQPYMCVIR